MVSSVVHVAPNTGDCTLHTTTGAPPFTDTLLSCPPCQKPTDCPSGEKKGLPPAVIAVDASRSRARMYNRAFAVYAIRAPSGDTATMPRVASAAVNCSSVASVIAKRVTGRSTDGLLIQVTNAENIAAAIASPAGHMNRCQSGAGGRASP